MLFYSGVPDKGPRQSTLFARVYSYMVISKVTHPVTSLPSASL